jgi:hypothetical protein
LKFDVVCSRTFSLGLAFALGFKHHEACLLLWILSFHGRPKKKHAMAIPVSANAWGLKDVERWGSGMLIYPCVNFIPTKGVMKALGLPQDVYV